MIAWWSDILFLISVGPSTLSGPSLSLDIFAAHFASGVSFHPVSMDDLSDSINIHLIGQG
jgi:hypothetical protein